MLIRVKVRLRRGLLARCRPIGSFPEAVASLSAPTILTSDTYTSRDRLLVVAAMVLCALIRVAIATEWAEVDEQGISWRAWCLRQHHPWADVVSVKWGPTSVFLGRPERAVYVEVLYRSTTWGDTTRQWTVTPSICAGRRASDAFVAAANARRTQGDPAPMGEGHRHTGSSTAGDR